jgi:membrane-associated phospholipid phosphatase
MSLLPVIQRLSRTRALTDRVSPGGVLLVMSGFLIPVSYEWLDRPLAEFFHTVAQRPHGGYFAVVLEGPNPLVGLAAVMLVLSAVWMIVLRQGLGFYPRIGLAAGIAGLLADAVKSELKFVFGRTWPDSWKGQHPSFLADGAYGFHLFRHGGAYQSFPSGHMAVACAILAVLWVYLPAWRPVTVCIAVAIGAALVVGNFHFLSDVLAGVLLGTLVAWATLSGVQWVFPGARHH